MNDGARWAEREAAIQQALERQQPLEALGPLEALVLESPDVDRCTLLGMLYLQLGQRLEAEGALRQALALQPAAMDAVQRLIDLLLDDGLPFSALQVIERAWQAGAQDPYLTELHAELSTRFPLQKVSIYTPGYASESTIVRCIRSIQAQTYPVHEILLVDDASPDRSTAIALELGVKVFYHSKNLGLAASCNTALSHATGDFFVKIDTDLELDPTWLERTMRGFERQEVGGIGGRLLEHRTSTVPDQWRRLCMRQHYGHRRLENPGGLYGADCIFRVDALKKVSGWNPRYRTNFEDFDLSNRLMEADFKLIYEPRALARHLRQDSLDDVVRNCWNWQHPIRQDNGIFDSLSAAVGSLDDNRVTAINTHHALLAAGQAQLLYPSYLVFYWWCIRDLQQVHRLGNVALEPMVQTTIGVLALTRARLLGSYSYPTRVLERLLTDLRRYMKGFVPASLAHHLTDAGLRALVPAQLASPARMKHLTSRLPEADVTYLTAFEERVVEPSLGPGAGFLVAMSVAQLDEDERQSANPTGAPVWVVANPPMKREPSQANHEDGAAAGRWQNPSRVTGAVNQLKARGIGVVTVDAVAGHLDDRETLERVLGADADVLVLDVVDGGLERAQALVRRLHWQGHGPRVLLVGSAAPMTFVTQTYADWTALLADPVSAGGAGMGRHGAQA